MASDAKSLSHRRATNETGDDAWVDSTADRVQALLAEEGLDMELLVFYDRVTEVLHAVGFDGAPARYFRGVDAAPTSPAEPAPPTSKTPAP